nr:hypothetical protein [Pseudonocardia sp. HH130629-09]
MKKAQCRGVGVPHLERRDQRLVIAGRVGQRRVVQELDEHVAQRAVLAEATTARWNRTSVVTKAQASPAEERAPLGQHRAQATSSSGAVRTAASRAASTARWTSKTPVIRARQMPSWTLSDRSSAGPGVGSEDAVAMPDLDQAVTRKLLDDLAGRGAADPELVDQLAGGGG